MWTKRELEILDLMIDREQAATLTVIRALALERQKVLQIARMMGGDLSSIAMARTAERFWRERAEDLKRQAEEAQRNHGPKAAAK